MKFRAKIFLEFFNFYWFWASSPHTIDSHLYSFRQNSTSIRRNYQKFIYTFTCKWNLKKNYNDTQLLHNRHSLVYIKILLVKWNRKKIGSCNFISHFTCFEIHTRKVQWTTLWILYLLFSWTKSWFFEG